MSRLSNCPFIQQPPLPCHSPLIFVIRMLWPPSIHLPRMAFALSAKINPESLSTRLKIRTTVRVAIHIPAPATATALLGLAPNRRFRDAADDSQRAPVP